MRRRVQASEPLFLPGDDTRYWYFLEAGCLRVFAPGGEGRGSLAPLLGPGMFFSFGSGGSHELVCKAAEPSMVICLDRRQVASLARYDRTVAELLKDAARWELELTPHCAHERAARSRPNISERRRRGAHDNPFRALNFRGERAAPI
jgi:CRP-like cAMP-binding protein